MRPLRCLLILLCLLTACRPVNPTAAPAQTLPTATLTEMPAVTATPQPAVTVTIRPSTTPARLFTRTASPIATPAPLATATPIPSATPPGMARLPEGIYGASPDGAWLWSVEPGEETGDKQTQFTHIVSSDGRRAWRVQPRLEEFEWGKASYSPLFWSSSEPYVFLAGDICCADGPGTHYIYTSLIRLDLHSGLISTQIPWGHFHDFRFSPGGKYFNRSTGGEHSLHITRLLDGQSREIVFPDNYADISAGDWSPDSRHFVVYACTEDDPNLGWCPQSPLLMVDVATGDYRQIADRWLDEFSDGHWLDAGRYQVTDAAGELKVFSAEAK